MTDNMKNKIGKHDGDNPSPYGSVKTDFESTRKVRWDRKQRKVCYCLKLCDCAAKGKTSLTDIELTKHLLVLAGPTSRHATASPTRNRRSVLQHLLP